MGKIVTLRELLPPEPNIGARIQPQHMHWQIGRYKERLSAGPGGLGRGRIWIPEQEGEQHNLILNAFYDTTVPTYGFIGSSQYAAVGTGSTAPATTQTTLVNEVARSNTVPSGESNQLLYISPGVYDIKRVFEFTETQVGGKNLTEWGFSPTGTTNSTLMTRELFRDGSNNPVVLTLATDQRLRLIYKYRVTLTPTTAQAVSVNINGIGIKTAQFMLTGRLFVSTPALFGSYGIYLYSTGGYAQMGDLIVCDSFAKSASSSVSNVIASSEAAPLTYTHTIDGMSRVGSPTSKTLTFASAVGRSRQASVLATSSDWNMTIKSVMLRGSDASNTYTPTVNLVFDTGQEITKDNLHKLLIANWKLTWGP